MSQILVDTDVWSFVFKNDTRAEGFRRRMVGNSPCISFATVAELYLWAELHDWGERRRNQLKQAMQRFRILGWDDTTAVYWARVRAERQRMGRPITAQDAWIAACALRHNMPLLSHNFIHFADINGLVLLTE